MKLIITFFNRTYESIRQAYLNLILRYKSVRFTKISIGGGLFKGYFECIPFYAKKYRRAAV